MEDCKHEWINKVHKLPIEGFAYETVEVEVTHCSKCAIIDWVGQLHPDED